MTTAELIRARRDNRLVLVRLPYEGPAGHARIVVANGRPPGDSPSRTVLIEFVQELSRYCGPGRKIAVRPAECVRLSTEAETVEALRDRTVEQVSRDRFNTALQQTGVATLVGMTAAELVNALSELGIRLRDVKLSGTAVTGCTCGRGEAETDRSAVLRCPLHGIGDRPDPDEVKAAGA